MLSRPIGRLALAATAVLILLIVAEPARAGQEAVLAVYTLPRIITNIRNWVIGIAAAIATLFLSIAGIRYMLANGDVGEVERAKTAFRCALLGYAIALLAPVFMSVLKGLIGAS
ncbi:pilin [Actinoplanes awajinensis]|uniref:pilin n=1 Tax=Actinoplanes awajinensis TaxID=135946 RepID=UPI00082F32F5|nr:pilin [Actinoplanes awajinensis]